MPLAPAAQHIQDKMVELFKQCDADYGRRVREGLEQSAVKAVPSVTRPVPPTQKKRYIRPRR